MCGGVLAGLIFSSAYIKSSNHPALRAPLLGKEGEFFYLFSLRKLSAHCGSAVKRIS